jgi:hypothetical protein
MPARLIASDEDFLLRLIQLGHLIVARVLCNDRAYAKYAGWDQLAVAGDRKSVV